jgi:hypothetical protein
VDWEGRHLDHGRVVECEYSVCRVGHHPIEDGLAHLEYGLSMDVSGGFRTERDQETTDTLIPVLTWGPPRECDRSTVRLPENRVKSEALFVNVNRMRATHVQHPYDSRTYWIRRDICR